MSRIIGNVRKEDHQQYELVKTQFNGMFTEVTGVGIAELDARVAALLGWKEIKSVYEDFRCVGIDPEKKYRVPIPMYCQDHNETTKILNIMRREYGVTIHCDVSGFRVLVKQNEVISFGRTLVDVSHSGGIGIAICLAFTKLVDAILVEQNLIDNITKDVTEDKPNGN